MLKTVLIALMVATATANAQPNKMILEGKAPQNNSGEYVYLYETELGQLLDSAQIVNGAFVMNTALAKPTICHLSTRQHLVYFVGENAKLSVDLGTSGTPYVRGSKLNDQLATLLSKQKEVSTEYNTKLRSLHDQQDDLSEAEFNAKKDKFTRDYEAANNALIQKYASGQKDGILGRFIDYTVKMQQTVVWDSRPAVEDFDAESWEVAEVDAKGVADVGVPQSGAAQGGGVRTGGITTMGSDGSNGESQYQGQYSYTSPAIGSVYENIIGTNSDKPEEDLELAKYMGKGNYTIVHIWSSFCAPCRAEVPYLAKVYEKYHSKGLEIIGIGTDAKLSTHIKWKDQMKITWPQIFDKNGRYPEVYGLEAIHMYIYDGDGKIVAKGTPGRELDAFFAEVYK